MARRVRNNNLTDRQLLCDRSRVERPAATISDQREVTREARRRKMSNCNDPGGSRTRDLRIKSPLLYQLSYRVYVTA